MSDQGKALSDRIEQRAAQWIAEGQRRVPNATARLQADITEMVAPFVSDTSVLAYLGYMLMVAVVQDHSLNVLAPNFNKMVPTANLGLKHKFTQQNKAKLPRTTIKADDEGLRKSDLVGEAMRDAGPDSGTPEVWGHLRGVLARHGMSSSEVGAKQQRAYLATDADGRPVEFTFKGVQTMVRELREVGAPPAKRGRPRKKPAQPG